MSKLLLILLSLSIGIKELAYVFMQKVKYIAIFLIKISDIKNKDVKIDNYHYSLPNLSQHIHINIYKTKLLYNNNI